MNTLYLATTDAAAQGGLGGMLLSIVLYVVVIAGFFYFLTKPQKKEQKRLAALLASLECGDCVKTSSGFYGIVLDISEDTVIVEFGNNKNCRIPMDKAAIVNVEKPEK